MAFEVKPNSGSLFENDKEGNESRPDMKGKVRVAGTAFWISGWWGESRNGQYLSLRFEEMTEEQVRKYMPEALTGETTAPPRGQQRVPARPASYGANSDFARRSQEAVRKAQDRASRIGRPVDDVPFDDDIPF